MQGRPHIVPICAAIVGVLLLRALIPIGYMPASGGSGFLFELCPSNLPIGVTLGSSGHEHHHHHHESDGGTNEACDFGYVLANEWVDVPVHKITLDEPNLALLRVTAYRSVVRIVRRIYAPRAPPAP